MTSNVWAATRTIDVIYVQYRNYYINEFLLGYFIFVVYIACIFDIMSNKNLMPLSWGPPCPPEPPGSPWLSGGFPLTEGELSSSEQRVLWCYCRCRSQCAGHVIVVNGISYYISWPVIKY